MNDFRRGTLVAASVLSLIAVVVIPAGLVSEHGLAFAFFILALVLIAVWGTRLGANAVHRGVFEKGMREERGSDSDFV